MLVESEAGGGIYIVCASGQAAVAGTAVLLESQPRIITSWGRQKTTSLASAESSIGIESMDSWKPNRS
jgi:hypothetical protein